MKLTIYSSNDSGNAKNCVYPAMHTVRSVEKLKQAIQNDHVYAKFKNNYRSKDNFKGNQDIKNYADYLCETCGGEIL